MDGLRRRGVRGTNIQVGIVIDHDPYGRKIGGNIARRSDRSARGAKPVRGVTNKAPFVPAFTACHWIAPVSADPA